MSPNSPIVVLDSGLGGLTVTRALCAALPAEDIVYFGDTARLPYGSKTAATVTNFVHQIITYLRPFEPKHVLIACNTATALALPAIRAAFPDLAISGVIEPGAKAAIVAAGARKSPIIGVLATEATIRSKAYDRAIHRRRNHARLAMRAAPLLVPIIEEGRRPEDPLVRLALQQYLQPLVKYPLDVLLLGCTHYPILKDLIAAIAGPMVKVIDSTQACAEDVARRLRTAGLLRVLPGAHLRVAMAMAASERADVDGRGLIMPRGWLHCFVTDDAARFAHLSARFLGERIDPPTLVPQEDLFAAGDVPSIGLKLPA